MPGFGRYRKSRKQHLLKGGLTLPRPQRAPSVRRSWLRARPGTSGCVTAAAEGDLPSILAPHQVVICVAGVVQTGLVAAARSGLDAVACLGSRLFFNRRLQVWRYPCYSVRDVQIFEAVRPPPGAAVPRNCIVYSAEGFGNTDMAGARSLASQAASLQLALAILSARRRGLGRRRRALLLLLAARAPGHGDRGRRRQLHADVGGPGEGRKSIAPFRAPSLFPPPQDLLGRAPRESTPFPQGATFEERRCSAAQLLRVSAQLESLSTDCRAIYVCAKCVK